MDSKLQIFAKVLLKERYDEFLEMIQSFNIDKKLLSFNIGKCLKRDGTIQVLKSMNLVKWILCFVLPLLLAEWRL